ncbi:MAG: hypothetical protein IKK14_05630 [Oscillospiraceae bacterium]|nr:hypothetical protein [Oscillospiraceae bacterium]
MNNKILMSIIAVIITILLAILLIWGASSCDARSNPVYIEGIDHSETEPEGETSGSSSSVYGIEDSIFDDLEEGELINDFEGSDKPSGNGSGGNNPASSSSSSSEQNSGSSSKPSSGSSSSKPSSGSGSSKPSSGSSSSGPTISDAVEDGEMTYEEYMAMDGYEQEKYMKSFESIDAFFNWFNAAKDKYEEENPSIEIGDGPIDMEDIMNGKNG